MNSRITPIVLSRIERDIADPPPRRPIDFAQPHHREPTQVLPNYITPADGVPDIGALTAAAVVQQYEMAAKAVEAMGEEMKRVVLRCEEIIAQANERMRQAQVLANEIREEGKKAFTEIEGYAVLNEEVAKTCGAVKEKIAGGVIAASA